MLVIYQLYCILILSKEVKLFDFYFLFCFYLSVCFCFLIPGIYCSEQFVLSNARDKTRKSKLLSFKEPCQWNFLRAMGIRADSRSSDALKAK